MTRLKCVRQEKGLTRTELARRSGVALSFIHSIESGHKSPTVRTLEKLAAALGVRVSDLLEEGEAQPEARTG